MLPIPAAHDVGITGAAPASAYASPRQAVTRYVFCLLLYLLSTLFISCVLSSVFYMLSTICCLLSDICYLSVACCLLNSVLCTMCFLLLAVDGLRRFTANAHFSAVVKRCKLKPPTCKYKDDSMPCSRNDFNH
jgi:hypothetical protein